jgi:hypothetical protein
MRYCPKMDMYIRPEETNPCREPNASIAVLERFHKWCKRSNRARRKRSIKAGVPGTRSLRAGVERTPAHSQLYPNHGLCENAIDKVSAMLVLRVNQASSAACSLDFGGKPFLTSRGINSNLLLTGPSTFSSVIFRLVAFSCSADSLFEEVNSSESIRGISVVR